MSSRPRRSSHPRSSAAPSAGATATVSSLEAALGVCRALAGLAEDDDEATATPRDAIDASMSFTGRITIVVCGEIKRGKTALINALLDRPGSCRSTATSP